MPEPTTITTTLRIPKALYTELKVAAVRRSTTAGELLGECIASWLELQKREDEQQTPQAAA